MREEAAVLGCHRTGHQIACFLGSTQAGIDFIEAAAELGVEKISRKIAIFEAAIEDQTMPGFPTDRIIRPTHSCGAHNVVYDVHQRGSGGLKSRKLLQRRILPLFSKVLNFRVKRILAWKMLIKEGLGDACGFGEFAGSCIGKALSSKER